MNKTTMSEIKINKNAFAMFWTTKTSSENTEINNVE